MCPTSIEPEAGIDPQVAGDADRPARREIDDGVEEGSLDGRTSRTQRSYAASSSNGP